MKEDIVAAQKWIIGVLNDYGYKIDMNINSLHEIDRLFENGIYKIIRMINEDFNYRSRIFFAVGSFVGEVIRREYGGAWIIDDANQELNIPLQLSNGSIIWPIHRIINKGGYGVYNYAMHVGKEDAFRICRDKRTIFIADNSITFNDDIEDVLDFQNVLVIRLENIDYENGLPVYAAYKQPINNVYGIDNKCKIVWNIKQITSDSNGNQFDDVYTQLYKINERVFSTRGFWYPDFLINIDSLEVIEKHAHR